MLLIEMGLPRFKDIKSKLLSARLLGIVVKNSFTFKIKRRTPRRLKKTEFDTIIVDMDGMLYKADANLEALMLAYPEKADLGKPISTVHFLPTLFCYATLF